MYRESLFATENNISINEQGDDKALNDARTGKCLREVGHMRGHL
jgi:hypothetical protein